MIKHAKAVKFFNKTDLDGPKSQCGPGDPDQGYDWDRLPKPDIATHDGATEEPVSRARHTLAAFEMKKSGEGWKISFLGQYTCNQMGTLTVLRPQKNAGSSKRKTAVVALPKENSPPSEASCVLFTDQDAKSDRQHAVILENIWQIHDLYLSNCEKDDNGH